MSSWVPLRKLGGSREPPALSLRSRFDELGVDHLRCRALQFGHALRKLPERSVQAGVLIDARDPTSRDATHAATFGVTLNCRESARDHVFLHAVERLPQGRCQRPRTDVARRLALRSRPWPYPLAGTDVPAPLPSRNAPRTLDKWDSDPDRSDRLG